MILRIADIQALDGFILQVRFDDGCLVHYDLKEDIATIPVFRSLESEQGLYQIFNWIPAVRVLRGTKTLIFPAIVCTNTGKEYHS